MGDLTEGLDRLEHSSMKMCGATLGIEKHHMGDGWLGSSSAGEDLEGLVPAAQPEPAVCPGRQGPKLHLRMH